MGAASSAARRFSTSARFSPACCRPGEVQRDLSVPPDRYDATGEHARAFVRRLARQTQNPHARVVVVHHLSLCSLPDELLQRRLSALPPLAPPTPTASPPAAESPAVLPSAPAGERHARAVLEQRDHRQPRCHRIYPGRCPPASSAVNTCPQALQRRRSISNTVAFSGACPTIRTSVFGSFCVYTLAAWHSGQASPG